MAFSLQGFQFNRGILTSPSQGQGFTSITHSYKSNDTLATITAPGYFPANIDRTTDKIFPRDLLNIVASDGVYSGEILTVNPFTLGFNLYTTVNNITSIFNTTFTNGTSTSANATFLLHSFNGITYLNLTQDFAAMTAVSGSAPFYVSVNSVPVDFIPGSLSWSAYVNTDTTPSSRIAVVTIDATGKIGLYYTSNTATDFPNSTLITFREFTMTYSLF